MYGHDQVLPAYIIPADNLPVILFAVLFELVATTKEL